MNPLRWFETPSASRKYADLIQKACSKWANWDPPKSIEVGDFGVLNEKSGQFEKHGNIYTHPETKQLAEPFPPVTTAADKEHVVTSHCKKQQGVGVGASVGLDSQRISMQFKFSKRRGAVLVMHEPVMHVIPNEFFEQPDTIKQEIFKKKVIVTEVFTCMGYALYLSDKEDRLINLNLNLDVVAGGSVNADVAWSLDVAAGTFRRGYNKERKYAPLYCIKSVRTPPRRRQRGAPTGDQWTECDTPWYELDSDGEEIDDTYDSNDDSD